MRRTINLKKGLNLNLEGGITDVKHAEVVEASRVAIVPDDYPGFRAKAEVVEGDIVAAGAPLLRHKDDPDVKLVSPIGGKVEAVVRGPRRKIERVVVNASAEAPAPLKFSVGSTPESLKEALKLSGLWAMMRQRPYDIVPLDGTAPRDIFVTALDTAPLAISPEHAVNGHMSDVAAGVKALGMLTAGHIYIGVAKGSVLPDIEGAEIVEFPHLHPAGNAGVQAANIAPVNKGEVIWTLDIVTLAKIGKLVSTGETDPKVTVAVTGSEVLTPMVVETLVGAELKDILRDNLKEDGHHHRIISGNVLTGEPSQLDGFLRYPYRQVTVIPEGDDADEFMGWASLSPNKMSESRSFIGKLLGKKFNPDARLNGGRRAMIMSEIYDRYLPMDILPEYLIKAIEAKDIDQMENLGIYEVAPEDFALAEYADPSKLELQKIVREGLDYLRSEV